MRVINKKKILIFILTILTLIMILSTVAYNKVAVKNSIKEELMDIERYKTLVSESIDKGETQESLNYVKECFDNMNSKYYNECFQELWNLIVVNINEKEGRQFAIKALEEIIKYEDKLDYSIALEAKYKLSILNYMEGRYSKAIQLSLNAIDLAKIQKEKYLEAKITVDLGDTFRSLGVYDIATYTIKKALEIEIPNVDDGNLIKVYAYTNLIQIASLTKNKEEFSLYFNKLGEYIPKISDENIKDDFEIIKNIYLAEYFIENNELEKAESSLNDTKIMMDSEEIYKQLIVDKDIFYIEVLGKLKYYQGNYDEAISFYEEALNTSYERENRERIKKNIKNLCTVYKKVNNIEKLEEYESELIEVLYYDKEEIGSDYVAYTIEKYNAEKLIKEEGIQKLRQLHINVALIVLILIAGVYIKKLIKSNIKDKFTGTFNRGFFDKKYNMVVNKVSCRFSVIIFDIDNFKNLNDTYGHAFGDIVIVNICKAITPLLGKNQYLFRYGGEEFVIIDLNKDKDEVCNFAESIRKRVEDMKWQEDVKITISIGVAHSSREERDILKIADKNLYISKKSGKNKVT